MLYVKILFLLKGDLKVKFTQNPKVSKIDKFSYYDTLHKFRQ